MPPVIPAVRMVPPPQREPERSDAAPRPGEDETDRPLAPAAERMGSRLAPQPPGPAPAARSPILLSREVSAPTPMPASLPAVTPAAPRAAAPATPADPVPDPAVPDATSWTGEVLRRLREARGITLEQLSLRIKVTRHHIENIEADRFTALPAPVYLRGILLSMARELRLDGQKVARSYLERASSGGPGAGQKPR
jgi:hypothetical protein